MEDYKVSEELCKPYCNGKKCPRERKTGTCPLVHNSVVRQEVLAARRARSEEAKKEKRLAAERAHQQEQRARQQLAYDQLKSTKTETEDTLKSTGGNAGAGNKLAAAKSQNASTSKSTIANANTTGKGKPAVAKSIVANPVVAKGPVTPSNPNIANTGNVRKSKPVVGKVGTANAPKPAIAKTSTTGKPKSAVAKLVVAKTKAIHTSKSTVASAGASRKSKPAVEKPLTATEVKVVHGLPTPPSSDAGDALSKETVLKTALPLSPPQSLSDSYANALAGAKVAAPIINGVLQNQYTTSKELCRRFTTHRKGCRIPKCRYVHDFNARRQHIANLDRLVAEHKALNLAPNNIIPASHINLDTYDDNLRPSETYASNTAHGIIIAPKTAAPHIPAVTLKTTFWGNQVSLLLWAKENLRSKNQFKLLAPYVKLDKLPAHNIEVVENSAEPVTLTVFKHFPLLPGELRNKIWGYAIKNAVKEGRNIRVQYHCEGYVGNQGYGEKVVCRTSPPALLNVCHESHSLTQPFYGPIFVDKDTYTVINFEHDELFLHTTGPMQLYNMVRLMGDQDASRVRHLVVSLKEYLGDRSQGKDYWGTLMSTFCNLKSLKLMVGSGFQDLPFMKKSYCQGAAFSISEHLKERFGKDTTKKAPKVEFEVISALRAHAFNIDELTYMGEGGWGTGQRGW
ncbi:hypothetical protein BKA61DRAFT_735636 [Leptodontidium sp. MPI-SDFR-AT-0119]|nr:hypothetical protein BKA61DRAFT_735636 [Leptodontidium sp. MPI-SDFR-AT-0119]